MDGDELDHIPAEEIPDAPVPVDMDTQAPSSSEVGGASAAVPPPAAVEEVDDEALDLQAAIKKHREHCLVGRPEMLISDEELTEMQAKLSEDQEAAVSFVTKAPYPNTFITGKPGTGKSVVITVLVNLLVRMLAEESFDQARSDILVGVTASTGRAGDNIGGGTIHSFMGLTGKALEDAKGVAKSISDRNPAAAERIKLCRFLLIDEVSMISGKFFTMLDWVARYVRGKVNVPFGGIHVIVVGDFLQLEPVMADTEGFAFQSPSWRVMFPGHHIKYLNKVFRQRCPVLSGILASVRNGRLDSEQHQALVGRKVKQPHPDAVHLYPMNFQVRKRNHEYLCSLATPEVVYYSAGMWGESQLSVATLLKDVLVKRHLQLRVGARVILLKNCIEEKNGTMGTVVAWFKIPVEVWHSMILHRTSQWPSQPREAAQKTPKKEWACQDEIDKLITAQRLRERFPDLKIMEPAIQPDEHVDFDCIPMRAKLPEANKPLPMLPIKYEILEKKTVAPNERTYKVTPIFKDLSGRYKKKDDPSNNTRGPIVTHRVQQYFFPVVAFDPPAMSTGAHRSQEAVAETQVKKRHKIVFPCMFDKQVPVNVGKNAPVQWRTQAWMYTMPLGLAAAISIHKSQGMSFERINADIGKRIFGRNMAYVAISRVTTLEGLYLLQYERDSLMNMNQKLIEFYRGLEKRVTDAKPDQQTKKRTVADAGLPDQNIVQTTIEETMLRRASASVKTPAFPSNKSAVVRVE